MTREALTEATVVHDPLVILTTSDRNDDIADSYDLHAIAYVTMPVDFESFLSAIRQVDDFFLTVARLPPQN